MRGADIYVNSNYLENNIADGQYFAPDVSIKQAGIYIIVSSTDFMIRWDGMTRVYITVKSNLKGEMKGLCGNNDGDITNDKQTSQGITSNDWSVVANSWKQSANCPDSTLLSIDENNPCSGNEARQAWAQSKCAIITDTSGPFSQCTANMEQTILNNFYVQCMYDSCK
jgi:mucin-19